MNFQEDKFVRYWLFILNISGLCIFRPIISKNKILSYKVSPLLVVVTIAILITLLLILSFQIYSGKFVTADDFTSTLILDTLFFGGLIVSFFQIFLSLINYKSLMEYGLAVKKIHSGKEFEADMKRFKTCCLNFFYPVLFIYLISFIWDCAFFSLFHYTFYLIHVFSIYISHYYNVLVISQYSMAIFLVKNKLERLQMKLRRIQLETKDHFLKDFSLNEISRPLKSNQVTIRIIEKNFVKPDAAKEVKNLREFYYLIYNIHLKANKAFSSKLLLVIGYNFLMTTLFIYFGIQRTHLVFSKGWSTIGVWEVTSSFRVAVEHLLSIFGLIYASDLVCIEVRKVVQVIHGILMEANDESLEAQLHVFLIQMQDQKIAFSPHCFFDLNKALFMKILGAVSSYLVILFQFKVDMN